MLCCVPHACVGRERFEMCGMMLFVMGYSIRYVRRVLCEIQIADQSWDGTYRILFMQRHCRRRF